MALEGFVAKVLKWLPRTTDSSPPEQALEHELNCTSQLCTFMDTAIKTQKILALVPRKTGRADKLIHTIR